MLLTLNPVDISCTIHITHTQPCGYPIYDICYSHSALWIVWISHLQYNVHTQLFMLLPLSHVGIPFMIYVTHTQPCGDPIYNKCYSHLALWISHLQYMLLTLSPVDIPFRINVTHTQLCGYPIYNICYSHSVLWISHLQYTLLTLNPVDIAFKICVTHSPPYGYPI